MNETEAGRDVFDKGAAALLHLLHCSTCIIPPAESGESHLYCHDYFQLWGLWRAALIEYRNGQEHITFD